MRGNIPVFIETDRLVLTKVTEYHCNETYLRWIHDATVNKYLETGRYPQTIEDLVDFVRTMADKESLFLAIHKKDTIAHIGNIKIDNINRFHGTAEYGILMGDKEEWGKGYAKEASISVLNYCFKRLNIRKVNLGVIASNKNAIILYEKIGFQVEGVYSQHVFCDGMYQDIIRMAIFKEKWV